MLFKQSSQQREECQIIIFIKNTKSLFTQNTSLIRKLTRYVVQTIKSTERGVSDHHFYKKSQNHYSLKTHHYKLENLQSMLFKQSSQQREECQIIIFIKNTKSLFTQNTSLIRKLTNYVVQTIKSTERGVSDHHFYKKHKIIIQSKHIIN